MPSPMTAEPDYAIIVYSPSGKEQARLSLTKDEFRQYASHAKKYCTKDHRCHILCKDAWKNFITEAIRSYDSTW